MILDTTIQTPEVKRQISSKIGESYSFIERFKLGGIGSKRMRIDSASEHFNSFFAKNQDTVYCNIEKRKDGIAIHFKKYQTVYSWLISKGTLNYHNHEVFEFKADNHTLSIRKDQYFKENKRFLETLLEETLDF